MKMSVLTLLTALVIVYAMTQSASAKDWQVDLTQSTLHFSGNASGVQFDGGFKTFIPHISFDPEHPEAGQITVTIDCTSVYTNDPERDAMLPQKDWFNSATFTKAHFSSTTIRKRSDGHYEAVGSLSIKGVARDITVPFTLTRQGSFWQAHGLVLLMRKDFSVGEGMFSDETYVKNAVEVTLDLVAHPAP